MEIHMQDPAQIRKSLGERIRHLRGKKGWSQEDFAHRAGLGRSFAGAIERGERDVRIRTLCKIAAVLHVDLPALFRSTGR
ncbi:MAG TPA: helix-turn-helix transcriptional regulator [Candidatus Angelobacter sp.]